MEKRLGRGLGALLGEPSGSAQVASPIEVPVDRLRPNPRQPREIFDSTALDELANSIRQHGVLQPVVVRPAGDGYELIAGERRWRAARAAGLRSIPVIVRTDIADEQMLELALVENLQRQDLDPIERARGFRQLIEQLKLTQEQVADKVGLRRATVANHLRLLDLPEPGQQALQGGMISMGHARALLGLRDRARFDVALDRVIRRGLSVRQAERLVREAARGTREGPREIAVPAGSPAWVRELDARMSEHLGTRVSVRNRPGFRGQIVIDYFNRADLDRLCTLLAPRPTL